MRIEHLFRRILLVHEEKTARETPLEHAIELARHSHARLDLLAVAEDIPLDLGVILATSPPTDLRQLVIDRLHGALSKMARQAREAGLKTTTRVALGTPFLEIIREVLRRRHDLVMIAAEGGGRLSQMLFGSTTMHLLRKCPCPLWVTHRGRRKPIRRILAAVDPKPPGSDNSLNRRILDMAANVARLEHGELHIVHTWTLYAEAILRGRSVGLSAEAVDQLMRDSRDSHKQWFEAFLSQSNLRDVTYHIHLLEGDAAVKIPELARRKRADLIVMGTVTKTGIAGFLIGSTAEHVLREVNCSVLTVKPKGFVTPVTLEDTAR
ncbi:MAG: universal stress protein [Candidatus Sumerlaeia bacterium]|nr:universal stress protein [Candidatus Sumerlaeia bacterium]